jgi:hypothetical protein
MAALKLAVRGVDVSVGVHTGLPQADHALHTTDSKFCKIQLTISGRVITLMTDFQVVKKYPDPYSQLTIAGPYPEPD